MHAVLPARMASSHIQSDDAYICWSSSHTARLPLWTEATTSWTFCHANAPGKGPENPNRGCHPLELDLSWFYMYRLNGINWNHGIIIWIIESVFITIESWNYELNVHVDISCNTTCTWLKLIQAGRVGQCSIGMKDGEGLGKHMKALMVAAIILCDSIKNPLRSRRRPCSQIEYPPNYRSKMITLCMYNIYIAICTFVYACFMHGSMLARPTRQDPDFHPILCSLSAESRALMDEISCEPGWVASFDFGSQRSSKINLRFIIVIKTQQWHWIFWLN